MFKESISQETRLASKKIGQIEFADSNQATERVAHNQPPVAENAVAQMQVKYAGFWIRWVASFIDGLVLLIPNIILSIVFTALLMPTLGTIFSYIILWAYYISMTKKYGATLGKKALGLQVASDNSDNLTLSQVIFRETIGKIISMIILFIGYMMAGSTKRKQALHDKIAGTIVVYRDPNKKPKGLITGLITGLVIGFPLILISRRYSLPALLIIGLVIGFSLIIPDIRISSLIVFAILSKFF